MSEHRIIFGDSRNMSDVPDKSVQLIITSPPYWQLKDYGCENQIGFNDSYEDYINNLNLVWKECDRVLSDGCRLCINVGDQFARSAYYGRYKVIPIRTEIIRFCETLKMDYMGAIIWQKTTTMNTSGGGAVMGSFPHPRNGILKMDYEFILLFKKQGNSPKPTQEQKDLSAMSKEEWKEYFSSHWHFGGVKQNSHIAMFPEELPKRLIKMFSFSGETVLDPFLGSATTSVAAKKLGRNSIGYEINEDFAPVIKDRLSQNSLFSAEDKITYNHAKNCNYNINELPYLFNDPHKMDKKVDIKKNQFGSRIDKNNKPKQDLYRVKEVISPEKILLNNGKTVKLLGIKSNKKYNREAIEFLKSKFNKRRVFLKFDEIISYNNENLVGYVYLDNKTFINKHLIKSGFVNVDTTQNYKYAKDFCSAAKVEHLC